MTTYKPINKNQKSEPRGRKPLTRKEGRLFSRACQMHDEGEREEAFALIRDYPGLLTRLADRLTRQVAEAAGQEDGFVVYSEDRQLLMSVVQGGPCGECCQERLIVRLTPDDGDCPEMLISCDCETPGAPNGLDAFDHAASADVGGDLLREYAAEYPPDDGEVAGVVESDDIREMFAIAHQILLLYTKVFRYEQDAEQALIDVHSMLLRKIAFICFNFTGPEPSVFIKVCMDVINDMIERGDEPDLAS